MTELYNRVFSNMFDSSKLGLFVFYERVREEAVHWENFTNKQGRKEVTWPEIPQDFE